MSDKYKGVVEIEILGAKRGFKFGMACMAQLCKLEQSSLAKVQEMLATNEPGIICNMYFAAAVQYAKLYKLAEVPTY